MEFRRLDSEQGGLVGKCTQCSEPSACHPELVEGSEEGHRPWFSASSLSGAIYRYSYHSSDRSSHLGFVASIRSTFLALRHPLICFSRAMAVAASTSPSKYTRLFVLYRLENPSTALFLWS